MCVPGDYTHTSTKAAAPVTLSPTPSAPTPTAAKIEIMEYGIINK